MKFDTIHYYFDDEEQIAGIKPHSFIRYEDDLCDDYEYEDENDAIYLYLDYLKDDFLCHSHDGGDVDDIKVDFNKYEVTYYYHGKPVRCYYDFKCKKIRGHDEDE